MTAPVTYTREQMLQEGSNGRCIECERPITLGDDGVWRTTDSGIAVCDDMGDVLPKHEPIGARQKAMLRQAAAEGQGNERLLATVAELEVWNDAALKREDELRTQCASLVERVKELEARVAKRAAVTTATPTEPSKAAEGQGIWEARWQALKRGLRHRYDTEHVPARKAEQDSILAEMYAAELPQPDANCECDGGCWSTQGCYRQQANKLTATPTEPTPPDEVAK